jgi:hypothetical protein
MQKQINVGIIKKNEGAEYSGEVEIHNLPNGMNKCTYHLINQSDNNKTFSGDFEGFYNGIANIINKLDFIVNQSEVS